MVRYARSKHNKIWGKMKSVKEIAIEIIDFTSQSPLYPIYQVTEVEKILKKYLTVQWNEI